MSDDSAEADLWLVGWVARLAFLSLSLLWRARSAGLVLRFDLAESELLLACSLECLIVFVWVGGSKPWRAIVGSPACSSLDSTFALFAFNPVSAIRHYAILRVSLYSFSSLAITALFPPMHASQSNPESTSNIPNPRRLINLQLLLPFPQQELDRAEIFLVQWQMAGEFPPRESLEVGSVCWRFEAGGAKAAAIEGEDVALEAG